MKIDNKNTYLGTFLVEKDAARKYNEEAVRVAGEFASLNEISDDE